jgi:NTP pyrophosphatase (non-canonical NTP hydrolase)
MGVVEEVGELAHHILKRKQGIRGTPEYHHVEIRDACADIIIYLTGVATREGFDLGHVVEQVWERVSVRDWVSNPETGDGIKDGWPSS